MHSCLCTGMGLEIQVVRTRETPELLCLALGGILSVIEMLRHPPETALEFGCAKSAENHWRACSRDCFLAGFACGHRCGVLNDARLYDLVGLVARSCNRRWNSKWLSAPQSEAFRRDNHANRLAPGPVLSDLDRRKELPNPLWRVACSPSPRILHWRRQSTLFGFQQWLGHAECG